MSISMQGRWTVSVKSKEAGSTQQQFVTAGTTTGINTYVGDTSTPAVHVDGAAWSIGVQHKSGSAWVDSFDEITFPVHTGTEYAFDIKANDDDVDKVFDDLILTCTTPATQNNFVLFGNVSWYAGCLFPPCSPIHYVAIESEAALQAALLRPSVRQVIQALHPERVYPKPVGPHPDPGPFRPLLLPIEGNPIVPAQQVKVFEDTAAHAGAAAARAPTGQIATIHVPSARSAMSVSAIDAANLVRRAICQSKPLAEYLLRFQAYTPTAAEAAGGPYTGTGARQTLGVALTDRNGNYVFHFTVPCESFPRAPFLNISNINVPFPHCIVPLPNIIVQVLDPTVPSGVLYETAPYFNTPEYTRIDVCVPGGVVTLPAGCTMGQIIQSIGNITVGPLVGGTRHTADTSVEANGEITSSSALGPHVNCAAWGGSLYFYACLDQPAIHSYTIRYGRPTDDPTSFQFVTEDYSPYRVVPAPVYLAPQSVGPTNRNLATDHAGVFNSVPSYLNAETDTSTPWLERWKVLKMVLTSSFYQHVLGGAGPVVFRIQGYDNSGNQVADDNITLFVDNNGVDQFLDPNIALITTAGPVPQSDCALFTLPPDQPAAPIQISFRSNQNEGFMASYTLSMDKGSTGNFPITSASVINGIAGANGTAACNFHGTADEAGYGATVAGELTVQVTPATGTWLNGATFCAFSINLSSSVRVTDGQSVFGPFYSTPDLIGIQQG
jgi:hypothetical protein